MWLYCEMLCRPYCCVRWICKVRMWWKLRWKYILQSVGGNGMLTSAWHLQLSGRLNISSRHSAFWAARERGEELSWSAGESQYHHINKSWRVLLMHACHTHAHNRPQSQLGSSVINCRTFSCCIPHCLDPWPSMDMTPLKNENYRLCAGNNSQRAVRRQPHSNIPVHV